MNLNFFWIFYIEKNSRKKILIHKNYEKLKKIRIFLIFWNFVTLLEFKESKFLKNIYWN